ncbi:MAG: Rieske 2Fe-2S domain-containing protein [Deltaproteobacteria bacterium]|nr:Rieske 2Fe-2S domain-containing protein [Deltaproteobacteria bacterium]
MTTSPPSSRAELDAGPVQGLDDERARIVKLGVRAPSGRPREVIVLLDDDGLPRAFENLCKHLPVPLDGASGDVLSDDGRHLLCGTHGALYRFADGYCVSGPCEGDQLDAHDVEIVDGRVKVRLRPLENERF